MLTTKVNNYTKNTKKKLKYNNIVEALATAVHVKKFFGSAVFDYTIRLGVVETRFSFFGFFCFLWWCSLYSYCAYKTHSTDQSILRLLYNTKLKRYGDDYEQVAATFIAIYAMYKLPFNLNMNTKYIQVIFDVDKSIQENLGVAVDHNKNSNIALYLVLCQVITCFARSMSVWLTIGHLDTDIPYDKVFQVMYSDVTALMISGNYCFCVTSLRERYVLINTILEEIKLQRHWEYFNSIKMDDIAGDQSICKKIRMCAKIRCNLYEATQKTNKLFGFALLVITFFVFNLLVLYMFYFMEATASYLVHDLQRYMYFLIYVMWQVAYATGIIYIIVYFSQSTVQVAAQSAFILQEIINSDLSPAITKEAMKLSMQLHHQVPAFTAYGLTMDYAFLLQGAYSVVTFLVMLLQFVMDS